jgi:pimeloyl-ACP methyl ester carboxylesterase
VGDQGRAAKPAGPPRRLGRLEAAPRAATSKLAAPPPRPGRLEEALSSRLFRLASPRIARVRQPRTPPHFTPFERVAIPRRRGAGTLAGVWFPAGGAAHGTVLLLHPWMEWGKAYFHRRGRLEALRRAGYHALTVDLPGFGASGSPAGFYDLDAEDAIAFARARAGALPLHLWGVSSGGYWAHPAVARGAGVAGAMFEDVAPHLFEWGWRETPWFRPAFLFFRTVFRASYRFLDLRLHAPHLGARAVAYAAGAADPGIPAADAHALAAAAGAECLLVPGAGHLAAIKQARSEVIRLALETFRRAEG